MGLLARVEAMAARTRQAWPLGPGVVEMGDSAWGHAQDTYSPPEYGDYIATSNGVYACATLRARLLSSLPLLPYRLRPRKGKEAVSGGPLVDLLTKVNPHWTLSRLLQQTELSLCLWGQAHWFLERGTSGRQPPREIWWGRPDRVRPLTDPDKYITGYDYYPTNSSTPISFKPTEVIWFRYPNPLDEFSGLSPMAAARLAADYSSAAMKANKNLFEHGLHMGGMISLADKSQVMTQQQRDEIETLIDRRYRGTDNAHRWMVLRAALEIQGLSITPKDADYLGGLKQSLEDICRAFGIPQDLIGGQHTYENVDAAMRAVWTQTMRPEASLIAGELTEQLLPMFPGGGDLLEFDMSGVEELQEEETEAWTRWQQQIATGAHTINEWREDQGLTAVAWGDVYWVSSTLKPVIDGEPEPPPPAPVIVAPGEEQPEQLTEGEQPKQLTEGDTGDETPAEEPRQIEAPKRRAIAYGSDEHRAVWQRFVTRADAHEGKVGEVVAALFRRQEASILAKLKAGRGQRDAPDPWDEPFDQKRWTKEFRVAMRPVLRDIVAEAGQQGITSIGLGLAFDVVNPQVLRFIEGRVQRFATQVNDTTWADLRRLFQAAVENGDDIDTIAKGVKSLMDGYWRKEEEETGKPVNRELRAETIARTEVIGANNGGSLEGWRQAQDLVGPLNKFWLAAIDDRTRDSHIAAHERYSTEGIPLERDFEVGAGSGPAPGQIGLAEEDIQCFVPGTIVQGAVNLALKALYAGPVWQLETRRGYRLTATPNHPILTSQGWLPAHQLREGMDVLSYSESVGRAMLHDEDDQHSPVTVEDVFQALSANGRVSSAMMTSLNLHGDALWTEGEVSLVHADGVLPVCGQSVTAHEDVGDVQLPAAARAGDIAVHAVGALDLLDRRDFTTSRSLPSSSALPLDCVPVGLPPLGAFGLGAPSDWYSTLKQEPMNSSAAAIGFRSQLLAASAGQVMPDKLISVRELEFRGHVYDLQSPYGWIVAQGIVTSNCRCTMTAEPAPF